VEVLGQSVPQLDFKAREAEVSVTFNHIILENCSLTVEEIDTKIQEKYSSNRLLTIVLKENLWE